MLLKPLLVIVAASTTGEVLRSAFTAAVSQEMHQSGAAGADATVVAITVEELAALSRPGNAQTAQDLADYLICPLTLDLPAGFTFPGQEVYAACQPPTALRHQVEAWGWETVNASKNAAKLWLPIVLTAKGALYAEVIMQAPQRATSFNPTALTAAVNPSYQMPFHLPDAIRQPLYALALRLLTTLQAPPSVYLMGFEIRHQAVAFDRLLPFPALPAIASVSRQTPDLFVCHWRCLQNQPITDLII